jgi:hypothetical protein
VENLNEIEEDDQRMTDAWKQDAKGALVFVSPKLLIRVRLNDKPEDWSFLRNCRRIYHRIMRFGVQYDRETRRLHYSSSNSDPCVNIFTVTSRKTPLVCL